MPAQETYGLAQKDFELFNSRHSDPDWLAKTLTMIADECEVVDIPSGMVLRGPDGYRQFLLGWTTAFPDAHADVTNIAAGEDHAVVEFRGHGTHTGPLLSPTGEIAPTGKQFDLRFCQLFRVSNSKVVSIVTYYDMMGYLQQLGLIPAMA
jgi:predicted ester cyclase